MHSEEIDRENEIAVIIPAYNAKETIRRTLSSIAIQKLKNGVSICVHIVNDGSDYSYEDIIKRYKKYYKIEELKINKNMGPGFARQFGVDNTTEKYITFIDADDCFNTPYAVQLLYDSITDNYDFVISRFAKELEDGVEIIPSNYTWMHGKMINRNFLVKNDIRFNNTRVNEDLGFCQLLKFHKPKTNYINNVTYLWCNNKESVTRRNNCIMGYYGYKEYCYNMSWAGRIALEKKLDKKEVTFMALYSILKMWFVYSKYYNTMDVSEILSWTKPLKDVFDINKEEYAGKSIIDYEVAYKIRTSKKENTYIKPVISFQDFIDDVAKAEY